MKASILRRLGAMFYDSLAITALLMFATALLLPFTHGQAIPQGTWSYQLYLLVVVYLYFDYCWRKSGQTIGLKAWKIRVTGARTHSQSLMRLLGGILSIATLGIGFMLGWPEKLSGTHLLLRETPK